MARQNIGNSFLPGARKSNFNGLTRFVVTCSSFLTLAVGILHIGSKLTNHCKAPNRCFTPFLIWQSSAGVGDVNSNFWRTIFTFNTSVVFDLWTPLFSSLYALHMHLPVIAKTKEWENSSWHFCGFFYLFMALFASFGYSGNLGIISGFCNILGSGMSFVAAYYS